MLTTVPTISLNLKPPHLAIHACGRYGVGYVPLKPSLILARMLGFVKARFRCTLRRKPAVHLSHIVPLPHI